MGGIHLLEQGDGEFPLWDLACYLNTKVIGALVSNGTVVPFLREVTFLLNGWKIPNSKHNKDSFIRLF